MGRFHFRSKNMIIVCETRATEAQINALQQAIRDAGLQVHRSDGAEYTVLGVVGDRKRLDVEAFSLMPGVRNVVPVSSPYKLASRPISISIWGHERKLGRQGRKAGEGSGQAANCGGNRHLSGRKPGNSLPAPSPAFAARDCAGARAHLDRMGAWPASGWVLGMITAGGSRSPAERGVRKDPAPGSARFPDGAECGRRPAGL